MRTELAMTKNVQRFLVAVSDLVQRKDGTDVMGLLYGESGMGKTTAISRAMVMHNAVFLRADRDWNVKDLYAALAYECGFSGEGTKRSLKAEIVAELRRKPRPIFIDEADYLLPERRLTARVPAPKLDAVRTIYDLAGVPIVLIGEETLGRSLLSWREQFQRRITRWVEFAGLDEDDVRTVAETLCEVVVEEDLLKHLHKESGAKISRMVVGLGQIETLGRVNKLSSVGLKEWGGARKPFDFHRPSFEARR